MEKSNSAGRNMRSKSPLLVIALVVLSAFLAFNYWGVKKSNGELVRELEAVQVDFREMSSKHQNAENQNEGMTKDLKEKQQKLIEMEAKTGENEQKISDCTKEQASLTEQLKKAQEELDAVKKEKQDIQSQKDSVSGELENVKKQLADAQNAPKVCNKEECKAPIREVLTALTQTIGKASINGALKQHNVDVMSIAADLFEGNDQPQAAQQPQGGVQK